MNDFATKKKPTAEEYLAASEASLIERLNNNPGGNESEFPFIKAVLDVRTAESHRKTNERLVLATWALCVVTLAVSIISLVCK